MLSGSSPLVQSSLEQSSLEQRCSLEQLVHKDHASLQAGAARLAALADELAREGGLFLGYMTRHMVCEDEQLNPAIEGVLGEGAKRVEQNLGAYDLSFASTYAPLLRSLAAQAQTLARMGSELSEHNVYEEESLLRSLDRDLTSAEREALVGGVAAALAKPVGSGASGPLAPASAFSSSSSSSSAPPGATPSATPPMVPFTGPSYPFCK